jgi:hypothetical protein
MAYGSFPITRFGGLNLRDQPDEIGAQGAIDLVNVAFDKRGAIRTREGFSTFASVAATRMVPHIEVAVGGGGTKYLVTGSSTTVTLINSVGNTTSTTSLGGASNYIDFTSFGTPSVSYILAVNGGALKRCTLPAGTTWTSISGPFGVTIGVQPKDNRAVIGNTTATGSYATDPSRVSGGAPELLSGAINPYFHGQTPFAFSRARLGTTDSNNRINVCYLDGRVYVSLPEYATSNGLIWVYDLQLGEWSIWAPPSSGIYFSGALCPFIKSTSESEKLTLYIGAAAVIVRFDGSSPTSDNPGGAINSYYRSGFYTVGNQPSQEAVVRETVVDGSSVGSGLQFSLARDFGSVPTSGGGAKTLVPLSSSLGQKRHRVAQRGRRFSFQVETYSTSTWQVDSLTHHVSSQQPLGEKTT